jgi:hypothetical protein
MITAKEAKQLYDASASGAEVDHYLKHAVEIKVASEAKAGKRVAIIHLDCAEVYDWTKWSAPQRVSIYNVQAKYCGHCGITSHRKVMTP